MKDKKCLNCEKPFPEGSHGLRKFCDDKCKNEFNRREIKRKQINRKCKQCGKKIPDEAHHRVTHCSRACVSRGYYLRKRIKSPEKVMLHAARSRAKTQGVPCTISEKDIIIPRVCPVLGLELKNHFYDERAGANSPSLDKINPIKGYVKGNVRVISQRANWLKNDATYEEMEAIFNDFRQLRESSCI